MAHALAAGQTWITKSGVRYTISAAVDGGFRVGTEYPNGGVSAQAWYFTPQKLEGLLAAEKARLYDPTAKLDRVAELLEKTGKKALASVIDRISQEYVEARTPGKIRNDRINRATENLEALEDQLSKSDDPEDQARIREEIQDAIDDLHNEGLTTFPVNKVSGPDPLSRPDQVSDPNQVIKGWKDQLPGGLGDEKTPDDFDPEQLKKGVKVELEHTDDPKLALEISIDHLTEDPKYYDKLEVMEKGAHAQSDDEIKKKIIEFVKQHPNPQDDKIHEFAQSLGMEPDELETDIYSVLTDALRKIGVMKKPDENRTYIEGDDMVRMLGEIGSVGMSLYDRGDKELATKIAEFVASVMHGGH